MNLFTRITATIGATAETAISRFENHDAIAQSAVIEARAAVSKARIRHQRLSNSISDIRNNIETSKQQAEQWTQRAEKLATSDENRAIQCLEERHICREQIASYTKNLSSHEAIERDSADKLKQLEGRLQNLVSQCTEMRSRESLAQATQVMDRVDNQSRDGVDAIFDRWESTIGDTEIRNSVQHEIVSSASSLQREMDEEDRKLALRVELAVLLEASKRDPS